MAKLNFSIALGLAAQNFKQGLNGVQNQLKGFANSVKSIIRGMTGIMGTLGIAEFTRQMIEAGRNFQQSMSQVQAVSGASKEQFKAMSDEAKRLGSTTKYSASEAANALENLTRNGMSAEDATVALSKTLNLAAAGGLDLAQSADIATNTMNAFKKEAKDVGHIGDVMAFAAGHSATNVEMLGQAMTNVAPIAQANNVSFEETTAMLGSLANVGIKGAEAGTKLRQVILGLSKPTDNQKKAFKALGVSITEQDVKTKGLTASLQKLIDAGIMKAGNSNELISQIFGSETTAAAASLLGNLGSAKSMLADIQANADGVAESMAKIQSDTLDGDIKALQSAWESFNIALFETTDGALRSIVQGLTNFIAFAKDNIQALIGFIVIQFAGIGLVKIFSQWLASYKAHSAQLEATASATATKRKAIEENLHKTINRLKVLEAQKAEATGAKLVQIEQEITQKRAALKQQLVARNEACNAQITAQNQAAAFKTASVWGKGMLMAKMSFIGFMTTVKTLFRSFAPLLIFELLFTVGMKVYDMLSKNSKGFMALAKVVGGAVMTAISNLASMLAAIFDYVADLFGLVDKKGKKYRSKKTGKVYNSMEELNAAEGKGSKSKPTPSPGSGGGGGGTTTTKTKQESDYQQWLKQYTNDIARADASLKLNNTTQDEYNEKRLSQIKSAQEDLALMKAANPSEAKLIEAKNKSLAAEREYYTMLTTGPVVTGSTAQGALRKAGKVGSKNRDTTFDYKLSNSEKVIAQLEFDKQSVQQQLEILKADGVEKTKEVLDEIAKLESQDIGIDKALKLEKVKEDVNEFQKQLNSLTLEGIQQGWSAIEGTVNSISSMIDTLSDPDASGWEKFCSVMNTLLGLMNTITGVMQFINSIQQISSMLAGANAAAGNLKVASITGETIALQAQVPVLAEAAAATKTAAAMSEQLAAAEIFAAHAAIPFVGPVIASGLVSTMEGVLSGIKMASMLSTGGIVKGSSPHGDFIPAYLNSNEMVLNTTQQSRLFRLANGAGVANHGAVNVKMRVRGRDLVSCAANETSIASVSGKRSNIK